MRGKESRVSLEPAFWLQNKARKTNMGLKLDFPKHCIPSHFTHHCGLQTRIESPVKSASDSGCCSHWKIGQMSIFWMYLKSESFNLHVVFRETAQFMLICYYHNAILEIKKFPLYSFAISTPLFPPTIKLPLPAWAAWADALNPNEGEARNQGYFCRQWHSLQCGPPPEKLIFWKQCRIYGVKKQKGPNFWGGKKTRKDHCCQV